MKKFISILISIIFLNLVSAQAPEGFKYQSVARDVTGVTLTNASISVRISILDMTINGPELYKETHTVSTNEFGLFSLTVGNGLVVIGDFTTIDWGTNEKFIRIETDLSGGTNFIEMGISQLLSVPYALYAKYAGTPLLPNGTSIGNTAYWNGNEWVVNSSNIFNNGDFVGVGSNNPVQKLDVNGQINIPLDSAYMINNRAVLSTAGNANLFIGNNAGPLNTIGFHNVFSGFNSGMNNTIGSQNTFIGSETGITNFNGSMNTFMGRRSGFLNTEGNENTFIGCYAGQNNSSGNHNSFFGVTTGNNNSTGEENTFMGAHAGYYNSTGNNNTFIGNFAGQFNSIGSDNVFIGFNAEGVSSNLTNAIAIGAGTIVTASNSVIIGNSAMTSIGGQVGWSTLSDQRFKTNIKDEELGLEFIKKLRPVRYEYTTIGQENIVYSGLLAQEVEQILKTMGTNFSAIVTPSTDKDHYSIRYAEFTIPLIKAVQEQQGQIEKLKEQNLILQDELKRILELEIRIKQLENN